MLECGELQLITREKCEKIQFKSEFTQSSVTSSTLNSQTSVEEVKNLLFTHTTFRKEASQRIQLIKVPLS